MLSRIRTSSAVRQLGRISRRYLSSASGVVHVRGDVPYGSREYVLLPPHLPLAEATRSDEIARLRAHRNIMFGAQAADEELEITCRPLLEAALDDCSLQGEQVQALSTLHGLSAWVADCCHQKQSSQVLSKLDPVVREAVQAIATGLPRPGHSVVGQGTFRDGAAGWQALAEEFITLQLSPECRLYQAHGAQLLTVEHLADRQPAYLASAGGAMARFVFL